MTEKKVVVRARLVPVPVAAQMIGVGRTKAFELIARGVLESVLLDGRRLVPVDAIDDLVARLRDCGAAPSSDERGAADVDDYDVEISAKRAFASADNLDLSEVEQIGDECDSAK